MTDFEHELSAHVDGLTPPVPPPYDDVVALRSRRRNRRRAAVGVLGSAAVVAAILVGASTLRPDGNAEEPPVTAPDSSPPSVAVDVIPDVAPEWDEQGAPPIVLQLDGRQVVLEPWTSCYGNLCSDGMPVPPFEEAGDRDLVPFSFPLEDWTFEATFTPSAEGECERAITIPVDKIGDFTFAIPAAGPPGAYDVSVFGRGPGGDVVTTFAWATAVSGVAPVPSGYVGLVSDDGDGTIAYPLELSLKDLATTPRSASATVTVTAADGATKAYGPFTPEKGCFGVGQVFFREGGDGGGAAFDLGPAPYDYRVEVRLDGTTYVGTAVWPRDERPDEAPYTTLTFDPPLPAYTG